MKKKYIIFDFDGTIANTNNIIIASWQATFRKYLGRELPVREIEATFGETLKDTIPKLIPDADIDEVIDFYREFQDSHHDAIDVYVFDGVREIIEEMRAQGCIIGVGTSRTAYSLGNYLRELGIENLIDVIVSMNDVSRHKPDPETAEAVLRKMLEHEGMAGAEITDELRDAATMAGTEISDEVRDAAILIGDTKYDIGCAQNAGIDSVLVGWSHYVDEEAMETDGFRPTHKIAEPAELLEIIRQ